MLFENFKINLSNIKNKKSFLIKLGNALYNLSKSPVRKNKLCVGGIYHKNYYKYLCGGFFNKQNYIFFQKNVLISEFVFNLKHNLCNYGVYFYKENNITYIKIFSGNSFILSNIQENFVTKYINSKEKIVYNKFKNNCLFFNFYEKKYKNILNGLHINICCKNEMKKYFRNIKIKNKSNLKIEIYENLSYKIFIKNEEVNVNKYFKNFIKLKSSDEENINLINLNNLKRVVNKHYLLYNNLSNCFDIFKTFNFLVRRITNDKNYRELV